jgi:hypothetical protein
MAIDPSIYAHQRRGVSSRYNQQTAMNALGRFVSSQRGNRQITDYNQAYQQQTPKFTSSYAQRGLAGSGVRSGVYQNALRTRAANYSQGYNRMTADNQANLRQYDLNQAGYETDKQSALADIEAQKARDIANAAAYLNALKGQFQ